MFVLNVPTENAMDYIVMKEYVSECKSIFLLRYKSCTPILLHTYFDIILSLILRGFFPLNYSDIATK